MAEFIEHFQEVAYISGDSVKRSDQNDIEAMPAEWRDGWLFVRSAI